MTSLAVFRQLELDRGDGCTCNSETMFPAFLQNIGQWFLADWGSSLEKNIGTNIAGSSIQISRQKIQHDSEVSRCLYPLVTLTWLHLGEYPFASFESETNKDQEAVRQEFWTKPYTKYCVFFILVSKFILKLGTGIHPKQNYILGFVAFLDLGWVYISIPKLILNLKQSLKPF